MSVTFWLDDDAHDPIDPTPFAPAGGDICGQEIVINGLTYTCGRDIHPTEQSRCMTLAFEDGDPPFVLAAWPGEHPPCEEDL